MSMTLNFEPHSWYKGCAIEKSHHPMSTVRPVKWTAYFEDGIRTYSVTVFEADTLAELKQRITKFLDRINQIDAYNRIRLESK